MNNSISGIPNGKIPAGMKERIKVIDADKKSSTQDTSKNKENTGSLPKDGVTLSKEQPQQQTPPEPPKKVQVSKFPQDAFMDPAGKEEIQQDKIGENLEGPRVKAYDKKNPVAIADTDGNFFYQPIEPQFDQVNSYVSSYKTLDMSQNYLGKDIEWAFSGDQLKVYSHAGEGANAYYARWQKSINFFYFESPAMEKTIQTSQSEDVVSHETGHAVLDGMKPGYLSSWGGETRAFHEAFADSSAMLRTLNNDRNLEGILNETGGDLRKRNRLSMLAEEFGKAIRLMNDDPSDDDKTYLRNARNEFKYIPPSDLPSEGPREELTSESHSFSRIFSGAFYDCINTLYDRFAEELPPLHPPEEEAPDQETTPPQNQEPQPIPDRMGALKKARDIMGPLLLKGVELAPSSSATFKNIALSMLKADEMINEGVHKQDLEKVFLDRKIITPEDIVEPETDSLSEIKLNEPLKTKQSALNFLKSNADKLGVNASDYSDARVSTNRRGETTIEFDSVKEVPLSQHGIHKVAGLDNLYADVHGGMTLAFDSEGKLVSKSVDEITREKIDATVTGIRNAKENGLVRRSPIYKGDNLFKSVGTPYKAEVYQEPSGKMKVRQIPIIMN
ncbi:MAG: hypothetical protein K8T10_06965 [Candidatus Eremiobacteraeota bacterium]|nr:hypothetical protein [Candidatus Eremiobacteraeota bacterium]